MADLTITRTSSSHGPDRITLRLRQDDEADVEVTVTPEAFALAITGLARVPAEVRLIGPFRPKAVEDMEVGDRLPGGAVLVAKGAKGAGLSQTVDEVKVPGERRILRVGDVVAVKPSRPRKRDGWVGRIVAITIKPAGPAEVDVTCPGQSPRTVPIARIGARKAATTGQENTR